VCVIVDECQEAGCRGTCISINASFPELQGQVAALYRSWEWNNEIMHGKKTIREKEERFKVSQERERRKV